VSRGLCNRARVVPETSPNRARTAAEPRLVARMPGIWRRFRGTPRTACRLNVAQAPRRPTFHANTTGTPTRSPVKVLPPQGRTSLTTCARTGPSGDQRWNSITLSRSSRYAEARRIISVIASGPDGGTGRHSELKPRGLLGVAGSTPALGTWLRCGGWWWVGHATVRGRHRRPPSNFLSNPAVIRCRSRTSISPCLRTFAAYCSRRTSSGGSMLGRSVLRYFMLLVLV
jgi:hypothetical protein